MRCFESRVGKKTVELSQDIRGSKQELDVRLAF